MVLLLLRGCLYSLKTDKIRPLQTGKEVIIFSTRNLGQDTEYVTNVWENVDAQESLRSAKEQSGSTNVTEMQSNSQTVSRPPHFS